MWSNYFLKIQSFFLVFIITNAFAASVIVDDFNNEQNGLFPSKWKPAKKNGSEIYKVIEEENNKFLNVFSKNDSINIGNEFEWDIKKYPFVSWRWRIKAIPEGTDVKIESKHDCAASVYVLIKNSFSVLPKYIKYVWTNSLEPETKFFFKKNRAVVVVRGKKDALNEWFIEKRNAYEDYKYFYGDSKPNIIGISILTDSNDTHTEAAADYDDIIISES